jgi:putative nucleotidyltransferase with HDIG domain
MKTRDEALTLLKRYTESESLLKHAYAVESAMLWYAKELGEDAELWGNTGLLHDFDYEKYPEPVDPGGHPFVGCRILKEEGYPDEMIEAILGHAIYSGVPRNTKLARALFACDELSGLITASVLVRPDKSVHALEVSSVKKKMKDKAFARGVNREDIRIGCEEMGLELEIHIGNVIRALQQNSDALGLTGNPTSA